jgi:hypothetical protein
MPGKFEWPVVSWCSKMHFNIQEWLNKCPLLQVSKARTRIVNDFCCIFKITYHTEDI